MGTELLAENLQTQADELTRLVAEHRAFDARLRELAAQRFLTPDERVEASMLKKLKLRAKDRMERLRARSA